jgi:pimeloyl-ACP methyl ester carboxylesterase
MTMPALVLVHGGAHAGDCWDLTVAEIHRLAADLKVLAIDMPGRRGKPGDLRTVTIADWVDSAVADIEEAGLDDVVVVAHSLGGVSMPGIVAKLGASRVREMVFASAFVPPEGTAVVDTLTGVFRSYAHYGARTGKVGELPRGIARLIFLNGVSRDARDFMLSRLCAESPRVATDTVSHRDTPDDVPRTWILTLRDRALSVKSQRRSMAAIGGVQTVIPMDTCHDMMVSEPVQLAEILVERCLRHA